MDKDEFVDQLLTYSEKVEALEWLKGSTDECELVLGEMPPDVSLEMVQELYALGANKVWAVENCH